MSQVYNHILDAVGNTPIVKLNNCVPKDSPHQFFAKLEYMNPGGSVKDRLALAIVNGAEKRGELKPGGTLVEATSGNTGLGLAMVAAVRGYKCVVTMPEKISEEKRAILRSYGAKVIITPNGVEPEDPRSHYSQAKKVAEDTPNSFYTNQYHNPDNMLSHYELTGPEIWEQMKGEVDMIIGGAGTGGTISGIGKFLKEKNPEVKVVCNDPYGSLLFDNFYFKETRDPVTGYLVEGIGEDMIPDNVQFQYYDDFVKVNDKEAFSMTRRLVREDGIFVGPSAGHALVGAIKYSEKLEKPSNILVMMADSGRAYMSKAFNDEWLKANDLWDGE